MACRFAGAVGDDSFGRFAVESLTEAGVDKAAERLRAAGIDNVATPAVYL